MKMRKLIREAIEAVGLPGEDLHSRPASSRFFPDGASWRVEISGIETSEILKATIDEAQIQGVPFHRAISLVKGSSLYTPYQLTQFARVAFENKVEVIVTPGPRPTWYTGRQIATQEGVICGFGMRGMESIVHYFEEVFRCIDIGFRGFLVWDFGVLYIIKGMRQLGKIPSDITFKWSIFGGCGNPGTAQVLENLGVDTINPLADLTVAQLATIRKTIDVPMDIHIQLWQSMGGYNRMHEAPDIARVASPCYFKMEPGPSFSMYAPWASEPGLADLARKKIQSIRVISDLIKLNCPELMVSKWGPEDLRIPRPGG